MTQAVMASTQATMMVSEEIPKRVRGSSPKPILSKRRKISDEPELAVNATKQRQPSKPDVELASAMALASLASLSPSSKYDQPATPPKRSIKMAEDESRDKAQERGEDDGIRVAASASWETRSPRTDMASESLNARRAPGSASRKVHFHPTTKEQKADDPMGASPASSHLTNPPVLQDHFTTPSMQSPRQPAMPNPPSFQMAMQRRGAFAPLPPRSPHSAYAMNPPMMLNRNLAQPMLRHSPHSPHHVHPQQQQHMHSHPHMSHHWSQRPRYIVAPPPPPQGLMQPPLAHTAKQWICDYCNVASFATYNAACAHEESCKHRIASIRGDIRPDHPANRLHSAFMQHQRSMLDIRSSMSCESAESSRTASSVYSTSNGPTEAFSGALCLALDGLDQEWLSELNCYIRNHCVEAFTATEADATQTSKRGRITLDQVGIRCCFCRHAPMPEREAAAVSFPTSVGGIYESVKRWHKVHFDLCTHVPPETRTQMAALANNNEWVPTTRQYWADAAKAMGLVNSSDGIRFSIDPVEVVKQDCRSKFTSKYVAPAAHELTGKAASSINRILGTSIGASSRAAIPPISMEGIIASPSSDDGGAHVVFKTDKELIPPYVYYLMRQVEPCRFTEADRFVARSKGPVGYPGFQCRHCNGHAGLGKYFPVSSKSLSTNSTSQNIHAHLLKCRKCPDQVKDHLVKLKIEKGRAPRMEPGWRRVFFDKVWGRLHE